jgi:hypothetical protein
MTALHNNLSASSIKKPTALESLKSTQPDCSTTSKKPILPKKPPVPLKQQYINSEKDSNKLTEVKPCVLQQNPIEINKPLDLSLKPSPQNVQVPPLPKK